MNCKKVILLAATLLVIPTIWGQNKINTPYSRFGLGIMESQSNLPIHMMGGMGSSWSESHFLNKENPASLPYLRSTVFDVSMYALNQTLTDANTKTNQWGGRLREMSLGFTLHNPINEVYDPVKRDFRWGMSLDLSRKTNLSYNITSQDSLVDVDNFTKNYAGEGGTYELKWGTGVMHKDFSFGASIGYLFGNVAYSRATFLVNKDNAFNNYFEDNFFVKGLTYNLGVTYNKTFGTVENIKRMKRLVVGARYSHGSKLSTIGQELAYGLQEIGQATNIQDTIYDRRNIRGKGFFPGTMGIGANLLIGNKYGFGVEINNTGWDKYFLEKKGDVKNQLRSATNVSFGGFVRPDYKSYDNFLKRVYYRYGFYMKQNPYAVNGVNINDIGVSLGTSMPFAFQRKTSTAHLSLDLGQVGKGSIIEEKYLRINFGFTYNDDEWFIKRKYN